MTAITQPQASSSATSQKARRLEWILFFAVILNVLLWFYARNIQAIWLNVPPAPPLEAVAGMGIGDQAFAYRMTGLMLQNLGDQGGRVTPLDDYDFTKLTDWFMLAHKLDPQSNFVPFLGAFYFGGAQKKENLREVIRYLRIAGDNPEGEKWRWLAQAVYLARFKLEDYELALELANILARIENEDMPAWARQMSGFVQMQRGDKEAALEIMIEILKSGAETMHPNEVNFTVDYICNRILDEAETAVHPLCIDFKE